MTNLTKKLAKKIAGLIMVACMMFSAISFAVFAHEHENDAADNPIVVKEHLKDLKAMGQSVKESKQKLEEERQKLKQKKEELRDELKEKIKVNKEEYAKAKQKAKQVKDELKKNRNSVRKCEDSGTFECKNVKEKALEHMESALRFSSEKLLFLLKQSKEKLENKNNLDDSERKKLLDEIDGYVVKIQEFMSKTSDLKSKDDIKEARKRLNELRQNFDEAKKTIRKGTFKVAGAKLGGVIEKYEKLQTKLQRILEKRGTDTDNELSVLVQTFNENLKKAKQLSDEAKLLFEDKKMNEAVMKIREAHKQLKEAHQLLKKIFFKINGNKDLKVKTALEVEKNE